MRQKAREEGGAVRLSPQPRLRHARRPQLLRRAARQLRNDCIGVGIAAAGVAKQRGVDDLPAETAVARRRWRRAAAAGKCVGCGGGGGRPPAAKGCAK